MDPGISAVSTLSTRRLVELVASFESERPEVVAAKRAILARHPLADDSAVATTTTAEAGVEEIGDAIDGLGRGPLLVGGAATLAALAGGIYALRRRGGDSGEDAEKYLRDQPVSRREMLAIAAIGGVGLGSGVLLRSQLPAAAQTVGADERPNVLAFVIDDLNDYPTFLGNAPMPVLTPNMDALAAESRTFLNHHVTVPICPPSRATLLFGSDVQQHRLTASDLGFESYTDYVESSRSNSLPALARRAGVRAVGGGKVFHADQYVDDWDEFTVTRPPTAGTPPGLGLFDYGPLLDDRNPDATMIGVMEETLRGHDGPDPFLMVPGIRLPHLPWRVPQRYLDLYPLSDIVVPDTPENDWDDLGPVAIAQLEQFSEFWQAGWFEIVETQHDRAEMMQAYLASMTHTDDLVGRLLNELASSRHADDTVVMLVSDNGYHQGENFAYRKLTLRGQATRTPFMIRPIDGFTFTPERVEQVVSSTSFLPTVLDVLGIDSPVPLNGVSLRDDRLPSALVSTHVYNSVSLVYGDTVDTGGRWTLHFEPGADFDPETVTIDQVAEMELYDHAVDPEEFDNLLP